MISAVHSCQLNQTAMKNVANFKVVIKLVLWNILIVGIVVLMSIF